MATTKRSKAVAQAARRVASREVKPETVVGRATREFNEQMAERARIQAECAPLPPVAAAVPPFTSTVRRNRPGMRMAVNPERDPLDVLEFYRRERATLAKQLRSLDEQRWARVLQAREQGRPWTEIAVAAGDTRQVLMRRARAEGLR